MDRASVEKRLEDLAGTLAENQGVTLVDLEFLPRSGKALLRVTVDRPGGITMDEIEAFSREFGTLLDVEDPIPQAYTLEVSSPGLTRPLRKHKDFRWAQGRAVRVIVRAPVGGKNAIVGPLKEVTEESIVVEDESGSRRIALKDIAKANLEFDLDAEKLGE